jgi:hypothetical protein
MQDVRSAFFTAHYSEDKGIQGFYDILEDHAQNMAVYPDAYQIIETFLKGIPSYIHERMIKDGLSPEINTINDFVAEAKKHEAAKKTLDYYNKVAVTRPDLAPKSSHSYNDNNRLTCPQSGSALVHKKMNQTRPMGDDRSKVLKPKGGGQKVVNTTCSQQRPAPPLREKPNLGQAVGDSRNHHHEHAPGEPTCYNCGCRGHISRDCKAPCKHRVHIRAVHTEAQHDPHDVDDELPDEEQGPSPQDYEEDHPSLNENEEYVEVEVNSYVQGNSHYERESDTEFLASMYDRAAEPGDIIAMVEANRPENGQVKMCKAVMQASKTARARPMVKKEDKECLTAFVNVGGFKAWTLWDSGSATTGITPTFAQVADIPVFPLLDPHILQLGMIGSHSVVNYGTEVEVTAPGARGQIYMDIANFNRYDMTIGTPYMRHNKVQLDFENDQVIVNGVATPAMKVTLADTDGRLHQYRAMDKHKE